MKKTLNIFLQCSVLEILFTSVISNHSSLKLIDAFGDVLTLL